MINCEKRGVGVWNSPSVPNRIIKKPSVHINGTAKIWYMWGRVSAAQSEHIKRWIITIIIIIITIVIVYHPTDDIIIENFDVFDIEQAWNKYMYTFVLVCMIKIALHFWRCMHIICRYTNNYNILSLHAISHFNGGDIKNNIIWVRNTVAFQSPHYFFYNKRIYMLPRSALLRWFSLTLVRLPLHPATRPLKTHSMAVRAIPLSVCHHGPPNGYRTGFKRCSDAQLFIQLTVVDDINAKAVEAWKQKRSI